jgi:hypothetical protein
MPGMDLEILSGLTQLTGYGGNGYGQDPMAAMMGAAPQQFNYLAGYNPELAAMMGWNPLASLWHGAQAVGKAVASPIHALTGLLSHPHPQVRANAAAQLQAHAQAAQMQAPASPFAASTPLSAVQPQLPGVPDRGGRVQPLGFENGAFTSAGPAVVTVRARPQRPIRGGRLVADFTRSGATATGLLTLVQLVVATDGQLLSGDPISFAALSPNAFGVGVNLSPAAVGNEIFATVAISALPAMTDRVDFNLTLFGLTVG